MHVGDLLSNFLAVLLEVPSGHAVICKSLSISDAFAQESSLALLS